MCPEKSFSWKLHFRQQGGSGDPYIICSQVSVNLHRLAPHRRKKSNYWWNNLQVRGPPVCAHPGCKSSELDSKESELVLRPGHLSGQASFLTWVWAGEQVGFRRTAGYQGPANGPNIKMPGFFLLLTTRMTLASCLTSFFSFAVQKHGLTCIKPHPRDRAMSFKYKPPVFTRLKSENEYSHLTHVETNQRGSGNLPFWSDLSRRWQS